LTNLLTFLDKLTKFADEGYNTDVIYLDFAKAFNKSSTLQTTDEAEEPWYRGKGMELDPGVVNRAETEFV
jgi:hypothetical protein